MKFIRASLTLMLVALWLPVSSHVLLESVDLIHEMHADGDHIPSTSHEHNEANHDLADGNCRVEPSGLELRVPSGLYWTLDSLFMDLDPSRFQITLLNLRGMGASPPGSPPSELSTGWLFSSRAALPPRAPSPLS